MSADKVPQPVKNRSTGSYGDVVNAASGGFQRAQLDRQIAEDAARAAESATPAEPLQPRKRNALDAGEYEKLNATLVAMITKGAINPLVHTNEQINSTFTLLSSAYGFHISWTYNNVRNAIARLYGVDPSDAKKNAPDNPFIFTAGATVPPIAFNGVESEEERLKKEEKNAKLREKIARLQAQLK